MSDDRGRILGEKMFNVHSMMIRWNAQNVDHCFDTNGRKPDSLTRTQMELIKVIHTLGKTTISNLEKVMCISKSSLSITISRMVKDGYVERVKDSTDGRVTYLTVTPKAINALESLLMEMSHRFSIYYESLSDENKDRLEIGVESFYQILRTTRGTKNHEI